MAVMIVLLLLYLHYYLIITLLYGRMTRGAKACILAKVGGRVRARSTSSTSSRQQQPYRA